ncbi:MAG: SUMF1/EgtB/PvdO family nonheme iron enzyme [Candidatus Rifleibacteriota bacterium]
MKFVFPDQTDSISLAQALNSASLKPASIASPSISITLSLINPGNFSQPCTKIVKSAVIDASGSAEIQFTGIPALSVIADLHIEGGKLAGYSDFHGIADLVANQENIIPIGPQNTRTREDILASSLRTIISRQDLFSLISEKVAARLNIILNTLNQQSATILEEMLSAFQSFMQANPPLVLGVPAVIKEVTLSGAAATVTVTLDQNPLSGLELQVEDQTFATTVPIKISLTQISSSQLKDGLTPVTPLINIDTAGYRAQKPLALKIPAQIQSGNVPVAIHYNNVTRSISCLPIIDKDETSYTVMINNFGTSNSQSAANFRSSLLDYLREGGVLISELATSAISDQVSVGFEPTKHTWSTVNFGSFLAPRGFCMGSVLSMKWAFANRVSPTIFQNYDENNTPGIWADDNKVIRLASMIQKDANYNNGLSRAVMRFSQIDDTWTFNQFKAALYITQEPQFIAAWDENRRNGHALLVIGTDLDPALGLKSLILVDPNFPGKTTPLPLPYGRFPTTSFSQKLGDTVLNYSVYEHIGAWAIIDADLMAQRWAEFTSGTIGNGYFPKTTLKIITSGGEKIALEDLNIIAGEKIKIKKEETYNGVQINGRMIFAQNWSVWLYRGNSESATICDGRVMENETEYSLQINLQANEEKIGLCTVAFAPGENVIWNGADLRDSEGRFPSWVDFRWATFKKLQPPSNLKALSQGNSISLSWDPAEGAKSYTVYYSNSPGVATATANKIENAIGPYTSSGLAEGTYYYIVTSNNVHGESAPSTEVSAKIGQKIEYAIDSQHKMQFLEVLPGDFTMGSPDTEGSSDQRPQHQVAISQGFEMGIFEVTQYEYKAIMGINPAFYVSGKADTYTDTTNLPVENVTWYDAINFCNQLSIKLGYSACYQNQNGETTISNGDQVTRNYSASGFRLPTEAEWEYACREKTTTTFFWGNENDSTTLNKFSWYNKNASEYWVEPHAEKQGPQPVGSKTANSRGFFDMAGNVNEWCWDIYSATYYSTSPTFDPAGPETGTNRVFRGGGWNDTYQSLSSAARTGTFSQNKFYNLGFRVCRSR